MKNLVVYKSNTGFTKQYAEWIAESLKCEVMDIKSLRKDMVAQYDCIVYGGWIMGNMISGLNKISQLSPKKLVLFAVGLSQSSDEIRQQIIEQNHIKETTPIFYMTGGMRYNKQNFLFRMMLKMVKKSIAKKENKTEQDLLMEKALGSTVDLSNRKYIQPLLDYLITIS